MYSYFATTFAPESKNIHLIIESTTFENDVLKQNWLITLNEATKIRSLKLMNSKLNSIQRGAFADIRFRILEILHIQNSGLKELKQDMFVGLPYLQSFAFKSDLLSYELTIEERALEKFAAYLTIAEIKSFFIRTESLQNLFGVNGAECPKLKTLDLQYNNIEIIPEDAFIKASDVELVYLQMCGIRKVHENAFRANTMVKELQLSNNSIETLGPHTFKNLQNLGQSSLYLNGNNWNCHCDLQWLKDAYVNSTFISRDIPLVCSSGKPFQDVNFCATYTTLQCQVSNSTVTRAEIIDTVHIMELVIENEVVTLEFQELENEPLRVKIVVGNITSDALHNYFLLWFNSNNKTEYGCITFINNTVITNLNRATTYTFSLIKQNETEISPKVPFGFTTSLAWNQRPWILNSQKALVLGLTTLATFFLGFIVGVIVFLCLRTRRNKAAGKSNSDYVPPDGYTYIENTASTKVYEKPAYWETYQDCFTPNHNKYDKVRYRPSISRSISEMNTYSTSALYDEISSKSADVWSTSQYNKRTSYQQNRTSGYDEFQPPLPPPNPQIVNRY